MSNKKMYQVLSNLSSDNKNYAPGSTIELAAERAGKLLEMGVIADPAITQGVLPDQKGPTDIELLKRQDDTITVLNKELEKSRVTREQLEVALGKAKSRIGELETELGNAQTHIKALEEKYLPEEKSSKGKKKQ